VFWTKGEYPWKTPLLLGVALSSMRLSCNRSVVSWIPIKGHSCLLDKETLPSSLSTCWFQEQIRARFNNQTKINEWPYGRLACLSNKPSRWISSKPKPVQLSNHMAISHADARYLTQVSGVSVFLLARHTAVRWQILLIL